MKKLSIILIISLLVTPVFAKPKEWDTNHNQFRRSTIFQLEKQDRIDTKEQKTQEARENHQARFHNETKPNRKTKENRASKSELKKPKKIINQRGLLNHK